MPDRTLCASEADATAAGARAGVAAVIHGTLSGAFFAGEFARRGWDSVAVTEDASALPRVARGLRDRDFAEVVVHRGDVSATAARLRRLGVSAVVAGAEFAVPLADALADALGLAGNDPVTSEVRRDKGLMAQALVAAGVPAIRTLRAASLHEALEWARDLQVGVGDRSCVLKPPDSGGSEGVTFCRTLGELEAAWGQLYGGVNAMGGDNHALVLQEEVRGTQILANSISWGGDHTVTDIWVDNHVHTSSGQVLYDRLVLLSPQDAPDLYRQVTSYTRRALTALGVEYGPAHNEIMVTSEGPVLIESGARPEGCLNPQAMAMATGSHHVRDAVDVFIDPQAVLKRRPRVLNPAYRVMLRAPFDAVISATGWQAVLDLPGVAGTLGRITGGSRVATTVDMLTAPDSVYLVGDAQVIEASYQAIRRLEADGSLYIPLGS